jgi:hypothetical protein
MVKKKILEIIVSTKIKVNNSFNNEKVIAINDIETEFRKQKSLSSVLMIISKTKLILKI